MVAASPTDEVMIVTYCYQYAAVTFCLIAGAHSKRVETGRSNLEEVGDLVAENGKTNEFCRMSAPHQGDRGLTYEIEPWGRIQSRIASS